MMESGNVKIKALILAAGSSKRLLPITRNLPKQLLVVGGKPILWYSIKNLLDVGVRDFAIVVGFQSEKIIEFINNAFPGIKFRFIRNPDFSTKNSIYSYYLARDFIKNNTYFRLAGDMLYSKDILNNLLKSGKAIASAVNIKKGMLNEFRAEIDPATQTILRYGKDISISSISAEAQGMDFVTTAYSKKVCKALEEMIDKNEIDQYPEHAYHYLIRQGIPVYYVALKKDDFWCDVDTEMDLKYAIKNIKKIKFNQ